MWRWQILWNGMSRRAEIMWYNAVKEKQYKGDIVKQEIRKLRSDALSFLISSVFFAILRIFPQIHKILKRKGVSRVSGSADFDIPIFLLFKFLVQYLGKELLCEGLGRVLLGLAIFVFGSYLPYRGDRHNRFHLIIPFICIDCGNPSLDSYLCVSIWPYPLPHSELLVLFRISAWILFT